MPGNRTKYFYCLIFLVLYSLLVLEIGEIQAKADNLFFRDKLQPISKENIFKTRGYYNWGSSILKDKDGKYHLFYSRWKKEYKFTGWLTHSEIAHAVSTIQPGHGNSKIPF